jgi:hypothetical protein
VATTTMSGRTAAVAFGGRRHEAIPSRTSAGTLLTGESDSAVYFPSTTSSPRPPDGISAPHRETAIEPATSTLGTSHSDR